MGKTRDKYPIDPVQAFHLTVRIDMKFKGQDARKARRWLYDTLRSCEALFAGFDGPRDPIEMTFFAGSGCFVKDLVEAMLLRQGFEDLEIQMKYQCSKNLEHHGSCKIGKRKKILEKILGLPLEPDTGQMKLM